MFSLALSKVDMDVGSANDPPTAAPKQHPKHNPSYQYMNPTSEKGGNQRQVVHLGRAHTQVDKEKYKAKKLRGKAGRTKQNARALANCPAFTFVGLPIALRSRGAIHSRRAPLREKIGLAGLAGPKNLGQFREGKIAIRLLSNSAHGERQLSNTPNAFM